MQESVDDDRHVPQTLGPLALLIHETRQQDVCVSNPKQHVHVGRECGGLDNATSQEIS